MNRPTILTAHPRLLAWGTSLLFIFLVGLSAVGWGQDSRAEPAGRRRTAAPRLQVIQLPEPSRSTGVGFEQALLRMMSLTPPSDRPLQGSQVGQLLWAGQGVASPQIATTTATELSLPMRLYVSLPDGIFTYNPVTHALQQESNGDQRAAVAAIALNQQPGPVGGCQIIIAGVSRDYSARFGNRARSMMALQAGQMAQSMQLQAVCQDLTFVATGDFDSAAIRRTCRMGRDLDPLYVILVGSPFAESAATQPAQGRIRRAVLIVPQAGFQDEELFGTQRGLESGSVQTVIASTRVGPITGSGGSVAQSQLLISSVVAENFDAIIFIGGTGTIGLFNNRVVLDLAQRAVATNRVIGASGNAPSILANAGVLSGVRVTALLSERDRLVLAGAIYTGNPVERAGALVTSVGPQAIPQFVAALLNALTGN